MFYFAYAIYLQLKLDSNMQKWRDFTLNPDLGLFFEKLNLHSQMSGAKETWSPSEGARACQFENCPSALSFICLWCLFSSCRCLDLMPLMKSFDFFLITALISYMQFYVQLFSLVTLYINRTVWCSDLHTHLHYVRIRFLTLLTASNILYIHYRFVTET